MSNTLLALERLNSKTIMFSRQDPLRIAVATDIASDDIRQYLADPLQFPQSVLSFAWCSK